MKCPGLVADDLFGFWRGSKPGIGMQPEVRMTRYRSGAAKDQRAAFPPAAGPVRGGGGGGPDRSTTRARVGTAGGGGPDRVCRGAVSHAVLGFTVKHFHEALQAEHGFSSGYTWTKTVLRSRGLVAIAPRRSTHRKKRPRRPLPGMMLFQVGSTH